MARMRKHPGVSLSWAVVILTLCQGVQAVDFAGGTGEPNDPYLIASTQHLLALGVNSGLASKCFKLTADIDLVGLKFSRRWSRPSRGPLTGTATPSGICISPVMSRWACSERCRAAAACRT